MTPHDRTQAAIVPTDAVVMEWRDVLFFATKIANGEVEALAQDGCPHNYLPPCAGCDADCWCLATARQAMDWGDDVTAQFDLSQQARFAEDKP